VSELKLLAIDTRFMPYGLLDVLDDLSGLVPPAGLEVLPVTEMRISNFRIGWQLPFVVSEYGHADGLVWHDTSVEKQGWWWRREHGTASELLAVVASRFGLAEIS
jgi:hypothetical protein